MSNEFFYLDEEGRKRDDWLHEEILDNEEADRMLAAEAIARAIARGMDPEIAEKLYAYRPRT